MVFIFQTCDSNYLTQKCNHSTVDSYLQYESTIYIICSLLYYKSTQLLCWKKQPGNNVYLIFNYRNRTLYYVLFHLLILRSDLLVLRYNFGGVGEQFKSRIKQRSASPLPTVGFVPLSVGNKIFES